VATLSSDQVGTFAHLGKNGAVLPSFSNSFFVVVVIKEVPVGLYIGK
jgi:hypothetical protein